MDEVQTSASRSGDDCHGVLMEGGGACCCQTGQDIIYCRFSNPLVFVITTLVQANIYICIIGICLGTSDMSVGNSTTFAIYMDLPLLDNFPDERGSTQRLDKEIPLV